MTKRDWVEGLLFAGFRLIAALLLLAGGLALVVQLVDSWYQFDPNYFGGFFLGVLFRPLLALATGALLHLLAGRVAACMATRFADSSK